MERVFNDIKSEVDEALRELHQHLVSSIIKEEDSENIKYNIKKLDNGVIAMDAIIEILEMHRNQIKHYIKLADEFNRHFEKNKKVKHSIINQLRYVFK